MIQGEKWKVLIGNNLDLLPTLQDNSIDSIVTDPPYELGFMGKKWDSTGIAYNSDLWRECLRVLKPGGHLLSFGGTRTWHRIAVAIEDAGFEVRDSIAWMYGSGFPKSLDISKAIDKNNGESGRKLKFTLWFRSTSLTVKQVTDVLRSAGLISENGTMASHFFAQSYAGQPAIPTAEMWQVIRPLISQVPDWIDELIQRTEAEREVIGQKKVPEGHAFASEKFGKSSDSKEINETAPATPEAQQWEGWGTALKPAFEPIVVARKPLIGTVAENVLTYGTGGLNIDGSRIETEELKPYKPGVHRDSPSSFNDDGWKGKEELKPAPSGRWPANVILDPYTAELLDEQSGISKSPSKSYAGGSFGSQTTYAQDQHTQGMIRSERQAHGDTGGASRFFYVADTQKQGIISVCKNTPASIVANYFKTIRATIESSAQTSVEDLPSEQLAQAVRSAGIQCDLCEMSIAHDLVALRSLATNKATSTHFQRYTKDCVNSTLTQNLVSLVEQWENIDTIPTTTSFGTLFGCVLLATDESTRLANLESDNDQTAFLYQAKASKRDRNEGLEGLDYRTASDRPGDVNSIVTRHSTITKNFHPTVKPTNLMRYLVKLVTPPNGVVLDPFTGSGSTGKAAILEGFEFIGIEMTEDYIPIIKGRLRHAETQVKENEGLF